MTEQMYIAAATIECPFACMLHAQYNMHDYWWIAAYSFFQMPKRKVTLKQSKLLWSSANIYLIHKNEWCNRNKCGNGNVHVVWNSYTWLYDVGCMFSNKKKWLCFGDSATSYIADTAAHVRVTSRYRIICTCMCTIKFYFVIVNISGVIATTWLCILMWHVEQEGLVILILYWVCVYNH